MTHKPRLDSGDRPQAIKSLYHLQQDYRDLVERIRGGGGFELSKWLPAFKSEIRPIYPGELVSIIGDTGTGKTAILQGISLAARGYGDVLMFQLELPGTLCFERYAAMLGGCTQQEVFEAYERGEKLAIGKGDHVYVCDRPSLSIDEMRAIIASEREKGQVYDVVMVDYLGLIKGQGSRYERTSDNAENLKNFAREIDAIVVDLCQIHRKGDDYVYDIGIHDAKDSGSIESASDVLLGVYPDEQGGDKVNIKILKNRKGRSGAVISARFDGGRMTMTPWVEPTAFEGEGDGEYWDIE